MPYKYHEGADKAYKSGRAPIYSDAISAETQKETERILREQIRRKRGTRKPRKGWPKAWTEIAS